jgi:hypothetical protein
MSSCFVLPTRLLQCLMLAAAMALTLPAQAAVNSDAPIKKKVSKKGASKKVIPPDEEAPDIKDAQQTDFNCDSGKQIAIFSKGENSPYIGMRWKQQLLRLTRVETSTGADRFESLKHGLVWIGIPAKGMLFDSKKGQQLANECKSAAQVRMDAAPAVGVGPAGAAAPAALTSPVAAPAAAPAAPPQ